MEKNYVQITLLQAIEVLTNPQPKDKSIIEEAIRVLGIRTFLLNIDSYDISEPVKEKLIDLSNIVEEFINNLPDKNQGGGNIG
ncbi:hypothetical protein [Vallitalea guaymasensis]|uniref:Uncharacterized protein n=1 Tax=Vallitalea guaymasensis TaxID=1185412 RepID=A0A8J8MDS6_9FIRM|nr:hypothetical protein [Vallitalea guaymasensis]QUH31096.1 hypothetical protein HYG85_20100 [Vallitalea guaymasensis]